MNSNRFQRQSGALGARVNVELTDSIRQIRSDRRPRRRLAGFRPNPALRLLDQCREVLRFHHLSYRTEQTYVDWIRRFIPAAMKQPGIWVRSPLD